MTSTYAPLPTDAALLVTSFLTTPWTPANLPRLQFHLHPSFEWFRRPRDAKPVFGPVEFKAALERMWHDEEEAERSSKILSIAEVPDSMGKLEFRGVKVVLCERLDMIKLKSGRTLQIKAMGAFEVQISQNKIGLWRDYYDEEQVRGFGWSVPFV
ncbi:hypothetical protein DFJ74DRAFT_673924 [Hyaloraphidium curvatum]|nr:hypothetical protein DFJ74DRAFT_673924 [Hyaloraphidium curvatum]